MNRQLATNVGAMIAVTVFSLAGCTTTKEVADMSDEEKTLSTQAQDPVVAELPEGIALQSEHWEVYGRQTSQTPQIVVVDAGLSADTLARYLPQMVRMRIEFAPADERGLPDREMLARLSEIGDSLDLLAREHRWSLAGWVTRDGAREFFVYGAEHVTKAMPVAVRRQYPDLDVEFASSHEPNWETYRTALYPTPADWQVIGNHRVLEQLRKKGDTLTKPRRVMHWAYFPSAKDRASFVENLDGFEADEMSKDDAEDGLPYALRFSHTTSVEPGVINPVTVQLMRLASAKGGVYDGWETSVERSEQAPEGE